MESRLLVVFTERDLERVLNRADQVWRSVYRPRIFVHLRFVYQVQKPVVPMSLVSPHHPAGKGKTKFCSS